MVHERAAEQACPLTLGARPLRIALVGQPNVGKSVVFGRLTGERRRHASAAVGYLQEPTLIESTIVQGPVLFTHDELKMARGEPCTTVQLFELGEGPTESIASFHCIPRSRPVVSAFTLRRGRTWKTASAAC